MKKLNKESGKLLADLFWNLVLVGIVAGAGYILYTRGYLDQYLKKVPGLPIFTSSSGTSNPSSTPASPQVAVQPASAAAAAAAPGTAPVAIPETAPATVPPNTPTGNAATIASTPLPPNAEPSIALNNLDRRFVPQQVKLLKAIELPIIFNGKVAGKASVPAGVVLKLVSIQGDKVEVQEGAATELIPATDTDIVDRVRLLMQMANGAPAAGGATPSATPWTPMLQTVRRSSSSKH